MSRTAHAAAALFLAFIACAALAASRDIPILTGRVVDDVEVLSSGAAERKMRIEVGYGLEGQLTDVQANRIIRNVMAPGGGSSGSW